MEKLQLTFNDEYTTRHKIGKGKSSVYIGSTKNGEQEVAVKLEKLAEGVASSVEYEARIYKILKNVVGVPNLYWYGKQHDYAALVIDVLGPSLADLLKYCNGKFSLKTVLMIADQVVDRLESIHKKHLVYRDIKPANFLIGMGPKTDKIYIVDFQLAERYVDLEGKHLMLGPATSKGYSDKNFLSIHGHLEVRQSRRDDLESLGYMMVYLLKGELPWESIGHENGEIQGLLVKEAKTACPAQILCKDLPVQFKTYFEYVKALQYEEEPDYVWIKRLFKDLFDQSGFTYNLVFDWAEKYHTRKRSTNDH